VFDMTVFLLLAALSLDAGPAGRDLFTAAQKKELEALNNRFLDALSLLGMKKHKEALRAIDGIVVDQEKMVGPHFIVVAYLRYRLQVLEKAGDLKGMVPTREHLLRIKERFHGKDHWEAAGERLALGLVRLKADMTAAQLAKLAEVDKKAARTAELYRARKYEEAIRVAREVIATRTELLGADHPRTAAVQANLAMFLTELGRTGAAEKAYAGALKAFRKHLPEEHPEYAILLLNLASLYQQQGRLDKALPLKRQAVRIAFAVDGPSSEGYARALSSLSSLHLAREDALAALPLIRKAQAIRKVIGENFEYAGGLDRLAGTLKKLGHMKEAGALYEQSVKLHAKLLTKQHPTYAGALNNYARFHMDNEEPTKALPLLEKAVGVYEKAVGTRHPSYYTMLGNLAEARRLCGDTAGSLKLHERIVPWWKEVFGAKHPKYSQALNNMAAALRDRGDYARTIALLKESIEIERQVLTEPWTPYTTGLGNLAAVLQETGDLAGARKLHEKALAVVKRWFGEKHPEYANRLRPFAVLHQMAGEYPAARQKMQQAVAILKASLGDTHPAYASAIGELAMLYQEMGDYSSAVPRFREGLAILSKRGDLLSTAQLKNNLGLVYMYQGKYADALKLFREAADQTRTARGERHHAHAAALGNVAMAHRALGDAKEALAAETRAAAITSAVYGEKHPAYAARLHNLAVLHGDAGDIKKALEFSRRAIRTKKAALGDHHPDVAVSLENLATLSMDAGQKREAIKAFAEMFAVRRRFVRDNFAALSERERLKLLESLRTGLDSYLAFAAEDAGPAVAYEQVLAFKGVLSVAAAEQRLARPSPKLRPRLVELQQARAALAKLAAAPPSVEHLAAWRDRVAELEKLKEAAQADLAKDSKEYQQLVAPPSAAAVSRTLPAGTALVEFVEYEAPVAGKWSKRSPQLVAFVLRPGKEPVRVPLGDAGPVNKAIDAWRKGVITTGDPPAGSARLLRQRVWLPVAKHLSGVKSALIAPDGGLARLPFAALPGSKDGTYLIEEIALGYVPSGRQLLDDSSRAGTALVALGGVEFGVPAVVRRPRRFPAWDGLSGAAAELKNIANLHAARHPRAGSQLLQGDKATRPALFAALGKSPGYLHLATHGWFEPPEAVADTRSSTGAMSRVGSGSPVFRRNPMLCVGLVLAGANRDEGDAYLTAEEVAALDLSSCQLAVLSACETGLGRAAGWQGTQGLQRAFHQAGARRVAASLWSVHDAATSVLMEEFYRGQWEKRLTPLEAMRRAQVAVLRGPGLVKKRAEQLTAECRKRGVPEKELAARGILPKAATLPAGTSRSPVAWWAAWQLSGPLGE
jgi:CHAT domain-containing protein/Tfp pilus assembly protein PilF